MKLFCEFSKLVEILKFLSNDNQLFSHQLPRVAREVIPYIYRECPGLEHYEFSKEVNVDTWKEILEDVEAKFGKFVELEPIPADDHSIRNPTEELKEMMGDHRNKVIEIDLDQDDREDWEK